MIRRRAGIVLGFAFAAICAGIAPVMLWWSFEPVLHTVGTVTTVKDGTCYVQYTDRTGAEHTHVNGGGKTGCRDDEGDKTDLYYPPTDPGTADTMSPTETRLAAAMMLGIGTFVGSERWLAIRRGDWNKKPPKSRKRRRPDHKR